MNRVIKFRYYDSVIKQFVYSDDFKYPSDCEQLEKFFLKARNYSEGAIQQFTGLKDKNGRDIYEGDIFIFKRLAERPYPHFIENNTVVEFQNGKFGFILNRFNDEFVSLYDETCFDNVEIIGNIFENPELCESKVDKLPPNNYDRLMSKIT